MAKKPRTPPPPRKVQAPQQRHEPRQGMDAVRKRNLLFGIGAAALIAVAVVVVVVLASGGNSTAGNPSAVASTLKAAGCTLSTSASAPSAEHIGDLKTHVTYSTFPPVSGRHYFQPSIWGDYQQVVDPRQAVHNEEHGGIVIWVGPGVSAAERKQIDDFYDSSPDAMLVTPIQAIASGVTYPKHAAPGSKVYLTAWTVQIKNGNIADGKNVIAACPRFDEKAFKAFRDEFRGKGPERYPVSTLTPGT